MTKAIGWIFFLLNPFTGGSFLLGMIYSYYLGGSWEVPGIVISGLWIVLYCLWFDGSRYQRGLV